MATAASRRRACCSGCCSWPPEPAGFTSSASEPGGARLGGRGGPLENFVREVTKYVVSKADCRVIATAPAAGDSIREQAPALVPASS